MTESRLSKLQAATKTMRDAQDSQDLGEMSFDDAHNVIVATLRAIIPLADEVLADTRAHFKNRQLGATA